MKHQHCYSRRYQRNSQTSVSASHESEEQLSELIRDYGGHGRKPKHRPNYYYTTMSRKPQIRRKNVLEPIRHPARELEGETRWRLKIYLRPQRNRRRHEKQSARFSRRRRCANSNRQSETKSREKQKAKKDGRDQASKQAAPQSTRARKRRAGDARFRSPAAAAARGGRM